MKIGMMELVVILLVAFFVLGPEKTVAYSRKIGKALRTLRIYINSFTDDIRETVTEPLSELAEPVREAMEPISDLTKPLQDVTKAVQQPVDELKTAVWQSKTELNAPLSAKPASPAASSTENDDDLEEAVPVGSSDTET